MLQEPGFLWDLYFAFYLNFNYESILERNSYNILREDWIEQYNNISIIFGKIPDDLKIFFYPIGDDNLNFVSSFYLSFFKNDFRRKFSVESLQSEFADHDSVIKNMISFFLGETNNNYIMNYSESKGTIFEDIKKSNYTDNEKIKLYEFLIDKCSILSAYYKENYKTIIDAYDPIAISNIENFRQDNAAHDDTDDKEVFVSFCVLDNKCFELIQCDKSDLYLLGVDYKKKTNTKKNEIDDNILEKVCSALSEKSRINILKLLLEKKEITCKDLEVLFEFSGSTAYHHISLMNRMGVLKKRNKGKTVYYSINSKTIDACITLLRKYRQ